MGVISKYPHLNRSMMSYDKLIAAIEKLEAEGIISFDDFEKLPLHEVKTQYFAVPQPTMIEKAKILIRAKRDGNTGPLEYSTGTAYYEYGKLVKVKTITHKF